MVDPGAAAPPHRPPQGRQGEPLVEAAPQFPAPYAAAENVHDDCQVDELLPELDIRHICDPDLLGACDLQALDQVRVAGEVVAAVGCPPSPGRGLALEAHLGHQPPGCHPILPIAGV